VRRIFEMAAAGWGAGAIAGKLNTEGVPTFHADPHRKWHKSYVAKVLNNRAVLGELQMFESERLDGRRTRHKLGDPVPAYFPVTVQFDLWRRAQAAIASRTVKRSGRPSREGVNLFSGMCKCGACGGSMELRGKGERKGGDYLTCANRLRKAGCSASRNYPSASWKRHSSIIGRGCSAGRLTSQLATLTPPRRRHELTERSRKSGSPDRCLERSRVG
jgi:hypothetical protein